MLEILLIALSLLLGIGFILLFTENKKLRNAQFEASSNEIRWLKETEELKSRVIALESRNESLSEILETEKRYSEEKQKELRIQLELLGKDLVNQGATVLKNENEQKLNALLDPLKERIASFEKEVREANKQDIERFASMSSTIKSLTEQHSKMHNTAQNLVDALKGEQKVQGDWGELALERILETSGLEKNREYFIQNSFRDADGNLLRPDVIIQLPDDKHIVIDSKVSLKAFEQYINASDEEIKKRALSDHLLSIKTHIKILGEKDYSHLPGITSPDFVLMFIPLESSFALAIKEEPNIYQQAWEKRVVLVTPSTLLATLKTVGSIWKQERQNKNAIEIAEQAGRLYDKFVGFVSDMEKIGSKQKDAILAYDQAMNKLTIGSGNLMRSAEKLKIMGAKAKKQIDKKLLEDEDQDIESDLTD
ncbi:MAG: DNA recombination protein RmuC [Bacteroidetes bacterium]|nr:MAG: DNA recombination protein RmuC [Bacteroidota bacterium]